MANKKIEEFFLGFAPKLKKVPLQAEKIFSANSDSFSFCLGHLGKIFSPSQKNYFYQLYFSLKCGFSRFAENL